MRADEQTRLRRCGATAERVTDRALAPITAPPWTPTRCSPVWVWVGWAGKAAARDIAHPREHPEHKRGRGRRVKGVPLLPFEGVAGVGVSRRAFCGGVIPFRAGPCRTRSPMDPPGKESLPHGRTTRARAPNTPRISVLEERATLVVARRGWPSPHNHHHIAPPSPTSFI